MNKTSLGSPCFSVGDSNAAKRPDDITLPTGILAMSSDNLGG
jgi:hypothetical protein